MKSLPKILREVALDHWVVCNECDTGWTKSVQSEAGDLVASNVVWDMGRCARP